MHISTEQMKFKYSKKKRKYMRMYPQRSFNFGCNNYGIIETVLCCKKCCEISLLRHYFDGVALPIYINICISYIYTYVYIQWKIKK